MQIRAILFQTCSNGAILPIGMGSQTTVLFEDAGEVALIGKPTLRCDLNQGRVPLVEQALRSLDPLTQDKLVGAFSHRVTEQASEVIRTQASLLGQALQGEILAERHLHEVEHASYLLRRQLVRRVCERVSNACIMA